MSAREYRERFDVGRVRKQIDALKRLQLVAHIEQCPRVARERRDIARDIDDTSHPSPDDASEGVLRVLSASVVRVVHSAADEQTRHPRAARIVVLAGSLAGPRPGGAAW